MPLRQIPLDEMRQKLAEVEVRFWRNGFQLTEQKRRERDSAIKDKVMASMGFVSEKHEGDAY